MSTFEDINLRPWRAELRQRTSRNFLFALIIILLMSVLTLACVMASMSHVLSGEKYQQDKLVATINSLPLTELNTYRNNQRVRALDVVRINAVIDQQQHFLQELVFIANKIPKGLHLEKLIFDDQQWSISGEAQNKQVINAYQTQLDDKKAFASSKLVQITASTQWHFTLLLFSTSYIESMIVS